MPSRIRALATHYLKSPVHIHVHTENVTLDAIQQIIIDIDESNKEDKLCQQLDEYRPYLALVFCHTRQRASDLNTKLIQKGYLSDELHGDLSQAKRERVMRRFSDAKIQILVATDIAARGLDIEGITHVFNYDIPHDVESYIHRIGRTGRAGQSGVAVTFVIPEERHYLKLIEHGIGTSIERFKASGQKVTTKPGRRGLNVKGPKARAEKSVDTKMATAKTTVSHSGINQRSRRKPKVAAAAPKGKTPSGARKTKKS
jgi:ATP-dependent RNA helicase DeaD